MEGDEEDGKPNSLNPIQQPKEIHVVEEFVKEAPKCINDVVKNFKKNLLRSIWVMKKKVKKW